jgi:hypothetical protein
VLAFGMQSQLANSPLQVALLLITVPAQPPASQGRGLPHTTGGGEGGDGAAVDGAGVGVGSILVVLIGVLGDGVGSGELEGGAVVLVIGSPFSSPSGRSVGSGPTG